MTIKKEKFCLVCGKKIFNRNYKYCSVECSQLAKKKYYQPVGYIEKACPTCGKKFTTGDCGQSTKYCSRECFLKRNLSISPDGIILKKCTGCGQIKPLDTSYCHSKISSNGFASHCKVCEAKRHKQWAASEHGRAVRSKNRKKYHETDVHKQYIKKMLPVRRANETIRRKNDLFFALKNRIRILMYHSLRGTKNGRKWQELAGYSIKDLRCHLEKQFTAGMTWERFLNGEIHIDHKIPISTFNFTSPDHIDFKRCWALKNLQPMWAKENISKSNKLQKPFQPALAIREIL